LRLYEGMFILDDARCSEDYHATVAVVHDILKEFGAEIVDSRKWDERKLAYPIRRHRRGVYVLVHFNAPPESIAQIERRLKLAADTVLRSLIVVDEDGVTLGDEKEAELAAREERKERAEQIERERQERAQAELAEEGHQDEGQHDEPAEPEEPHEPDNDTDDNEEKPGDGDER